MSDDASNPGDAPTPDDDATMTQRDTDAEVREPTDEEPAVDDDLAEEAAPDDEAASSGDDEPTAGESAEQRARERHQRSAERTQDREQERKRRRRGTREFDPVDADDELRELGRREVERLFDVLEAALTGPDRLDQDSLDTLLSALETAIVDPARVDSEEIDRMLTLWEAVLVDATSFDDAERVLEVFEAAGVEGDRPRTGIVGFLRQLGLDDLLGGDTDARRALGGGEDDPVDSYRLARLIATVTRNATLNSGQSGVRVGTELARAAATARSPAELLDDSRSIALAELERLGVDTGVEPETFERREQSDRERTLRERGEALLEQSADLDYTEETHPAYDAVVDQLAPDEARILRLLAAEGPQPMVDVYDLGWLPLGSTVVARHLTMLASNSGARHDERTPAYLHNLERLGLVWFAEEPVDDLERYRVLEAQPPVEQAEREATRVKFVRRSVHLTPFGAEFCRVALGVDVVEGATGVLGDVFPVE